MHRKHLNNDFERFIYWCYAKKSLYTAVYGICFELLYFFNMNMHYYIHTIIYMLLISCTTLNRCPPHLTMLDLPVAWVMISNANRRSLCTHGAFSIVISTISHIFHTKTFDQGRDTLALFLWPTWFHQTFVQCEPCSSQKKHLAYLHIAIIKYLFNLACYILKWMGLGIHTYSNASW